MRCASIRRSMLLGAFAVATPGCFLDDILSGGPKNPHAGVVTLSTGIDMAYHELGDHHGDVVIFLHGYTDTSRSFMPTASALLDLDDDYRVFVLDQRGHGGSSMPPAAACAAAPEQCFAPADMAADVIAFMDAKGIASASIVGHSMGSFVAQELGLTHPQRVDKLVLIGTAASVVGNVVLQDYILAEPVEGAWKAGFVGQGLDFPADVYDLDPLDADADAQAWIEGSWVVDPAADPDFLADIVPETAATRMGTWIGVARALLQTDNSERLEDLEVPTLILWATQDGFFYDDPDQQALRAALDVAVDACKLEYYFKQYGKRPLGPDGVQIDDIGHNTQWATPDEVARDLAAYLGSGAPTPDWYYSADGDPQQIVTEAGVAPIVHKQCE